ncbi:MAG TPA: hypothetical protein VHB21_25445 [Minicystis sp.]|nr:hypothetical protein [Minicystis sp.]
MTTSTRLFAALFPCALALAGCAPSWAAERTAPWPRQESASRAIAWRLPEGAERGAFAANVLGHPAHVELATRVEDGVDVRGNLVLVVMAVHFDDAVLPPLDDAELAADRDAFANRAAGERLVRFERRDTSGLPGFEAEETVPVPGGGRGRVVMRAASGERTAYIAIAAWADAPSLEASARPIAGRLFDSLRITDRPPMPRDAAGPVVARSVLAGVAGQALGRARGGKT